MKGILVLLFTVGILSLAAGCVMPEQQMVPPSPENETFAPATIRIHFNDQELIAELYDNPTAEDLASLLPLTLTFRDYSGTEKISYPPRDLNTTDVPAGHDPAAGDITLYAPWENIAIFYRDFSYSPGLVPIGHITSGLEHLSAVDGEFTATIEAAIPQNMS